MARWPEWWTWEIELSPHLLKRMSDRRFNETDLRLMLQQGTGYREDIEEGRWVVSLVYERRAWEIIVEPLIDEKLLLIVTTYPIV